MNGEYEQIQDTTEVASKAFVGGGGRDRGLIRGFLEAHRSLYSFSLRTGLGIEDGEDRMRLQRGLTLLEKADLDTVDGKKAAVAYLTMQLESASRLVEVVRGMEEQMEAIDFFEYAMGDTPDRIVAYEGAIDFLST